MIEDLILAHELQFAFDHEGILEADMDENLQLNIYRIIQEQLNNILKHAEATEIIISLAKSDDQIFLKISDNGKGCEMNSEKKGNGIININSRALLYNGTVSIESQPGRGFMLEVNLFNRKSSY